MNRFFLCLRSRPQTHNLSVRLDNTLIPLGGVEAYMDHTFPSEAGMFNVLIKLPCRTLWQAALMEFATWVDERFPQDSRPHETQTQSEAYHFCVFCCDLPIQCEALELPGSLIWRGPICQLEDATCGRGCLPIARISASRHAASQINFWI